MPGMSSKEIPVLPVLLNKNDETAFGLAGVASRSFSPALKINTVGIKSSVQIRGPPRHKPPNIADIAGTVREGFKVCHTP